MTTQSDDDLVKEAIQAVRDAVLTAEDMGLTYQALSVSAPGIAVTDYTDDGKIRGTVQLRLEERTTGEWEYGTALLNENGVLWDEEIAPSEQNAREQHAHCRDNPELYAPDQCVMVRRTKAISAGPWEIVPTDERSE